MQYPHERRWYGAPAIVEAARTALAADPRIGVVVPPPGVPLRVLDGESAISFTASEPIALWPGLKDDRPQTITALHGAL
jgi:hypothetical protein